jgi:hypothetical protein
MAGWKSAVRIGSISVVSDCAPITSGLALAVQRLLGRMMKKE